MPASSSPSLSWGAKTALVLGSLVFTFLLAEGAVRVIEAVRGPLLAQRGGDSSRPKPQAHHDLIGYEDVPNFTLTMRFDEHPKKRVDMKTNNLGLREDEDTTVARPPGVYRILALGDSQTAGFVYNSETWTAVLERLLNERAPRRDGRKYEVLNAGVNGYAPLREYLWWKAHGRDMNPDLVILAAYSGNDFYDAGRGRYTKRPDGTWDLDLTPWPEQKPSALSRVLSHSRIWQIASAPFREEASEGESGRSTLIDSPEFRAKYGDLYLAARRECQGCFTQSLLQTHLLSTGNPSEYEGDVEITGDILRRLSLETKAARQKLVVAMLPAKLQVEGDPSGQAAKVAAAMKISIPDPSFEDRFERVVTDACTAHAIALADPKVPFIARDRAAGEPLFYRDDWHLNVRGNEVLAEVLFELPAIRTAIAEDPAAASYQADRADRAE